jgi:hypothetical protein
LDPPEVIWLDAAGLVENQAMVLTYENHHHSSSRLHAAYAVLQRALFFKQNTFSICYIQNSSAV